MKNSDIRLLVLCLLFFAAWCAGATRNPVLVLKNANYNQNTSVNGKLISMLTGNVIFTYDEVTIRSDQATWYRDDGRINFSGGIRVTMKKQLLICNKMEFDRNEKLLIARGNVDFYDTSKQIRVLAPHAAYNTQTKYLTLNDNPKLFQYDTVHAETLCIVSKRMLYDDSLKTATAENDVVITKGILRSYCSLARYNTETHIARLKIKPKIFYDIHELTGDSVNLFFVQDALRGVAVMRNSKGLHRDIAENDTIITKIFGDSLYMALSDSGIIETIWSYKDAATYYYSNKDSLTMNTADGKIMILHFTQGKAGNVKICGNARSTYFLENNTEKNEASGDTLAIDFKRGKAVYLKFIGGVRGTYYAANTSAPRSTKKQ